MSDRMVEALIGIVIIGFLLWNMFNSEPKCAENDEQCYDYYQSMQDGR